MERKKSSLSDPAELSRSDKHKIAIRKLFDRAEVDGYTFGRSREFYTDVASDGYLDLYPELRVYEKRPDRRRKSGHRWDLAKTYRTLSERERRVGL